MCLVQHLGAPHLITFFTFFRCENHELGGNEKIFLEYFYPENWGILVPFDYPP